LILTGIAFGGSPAVAGILTGSLQSDYYMYEDAGENSRYVFVQTLAGETVLPRLFSPRNPWKLSFSGEFRDQNLPGKGLEDARLTSLVLSRSVIRGKVKVRLGRFLASAGGFSPIDGFELSVPSLPVRTTIAYGYEHYSFYRIDESDLPERTRLGLNLAGVIPQGPTWSLDHATRFNGGEIDDQITTVRLRCRRFARFGWDARLGYDSQASVVRDWMYGILVKPTKDLQLNLRYTERSMAIYQNAVLSNFEIEPTRLAGLTARYSLAEGRYWLGLGYNRRFREDSDLDRIFLSIASDLGEAGVRLQSGENMGQVGGWLSVGGKVAKKLTWGASVNFDRWDSAWDSEPTEAWANSLKLGYPLGEVANIEGRLEQYQTGEFDSDIRGLLTFKMRYGI